MMMRPIFLDLIIYVDMPKIPCLRNSMFAIHTIYCSSGVDCADPWTGPQSFLHHPSLPLPVVCLHPGWSWLPSLLPAGPLHSHLCQGGEDSDQGGKAREDGQPGGEGGSASTQAEEQREEKLKHWPRLLRGALLFCQGGSCQRDQTAWRIKGHILFLVRLNLWLFW